MVIQLHENQHGLIGLNGDLSEPIPITNGVKHGCVPASDFSIFFTTMLKHVIDQICTLSIVPPIPHKDQGDQDLDRDLLFALIAHTEQALLHITCGIVDASQLIGHEVSLRKTEVLHQTTPRHVELKSTQQITVMGNIIIISSDARIIRKIYNRLTKANNSFGRLYQRVWSNIGMKNKTKTIQIYRAVVPNTIHYDADTWVTYHSHIRLLERCLRNILNIRWSDFITNIEVLEQVKIPNIEAMPLKYQLKLAGHVSRMEDNRLPNVVQYGELSTGHRERGAPLKGNKDRLKKSLIPCHVDPLHWSDMAGDRDAWRHSKWSTSLNKTKEMC